MWEELGRQPTITDVKNGCSRYSPNAFVRRFNGWRNALETFVEWANNSDDGLAFDKNPSMTDDKESDAPYVLGPLPEENVHKDTRQSEHTFDTP